ncbi:MAG: 2-amino-4-hydroxy-6-hydroxymethyldihydropteridine diphosphokinase [Gammaproteobacteria bacterium]|nr:2-amino-4-hydroxy-6-hydroxymethyldihydropteridine diphosphokinase [Gammaproteobacteria bacterium]
MARIYLSLGSNIDRERSLRGAITHLREHFGELTVSRVFESTAVGFDGEDFYNLCVGLDTDMDVLEVNRVLHDIEDQYGRDRNGPRFSSRTLDIDLLLYDDLVMKEGKLELPRDEITKHAFVLWPLAEVAADTLHPTEGKTIAELWRDFDKASQALHPVDFDPAQ